MTPRLKPTCSDMYNRGIQICCFVASIRISRYNPAEKVSLQFGELVCFMDMMKVCGEVTGDRDMRDTLARGIFDHVLAVDGSVVQSLESVTYDICLASAASPSYMGLPIRKPRLVLAVLASAAKSVGGVHQFLLTLSHFSYDDNQSLNPTRSQHDTWMIYTTFSYLKQDDSYSPHTAAVNISYFDHASHFSIGDAHFVNNEITVQNQAYAVRERKAELQSLYRLVARGASHDSKDQYGAPKCDPDTRKQLLSDIHEWIKVPDKETGIMFWEVLHSALCMRTCRIRRTLGASFFFWRGSSTRNNEGQLITTLAYQLAEGNKELRQYILSELEDNPQIVDMPLETQFQKLILEPCHKVPHERLLIRAIIIDGLDECIGEEIQVAIMQMLARAVRYDGFPLGIFITSRPELHLQEVFNTKEIIFATNIISLDCIPGVLQDIRMVLQSGFSRIQNNPRFKKALKPVLRPWPSADNIEKLVQRSSGQFIYTATVLKYISSPDHNPASQLEIVLGIRDSSTESSLLADLDLLYQEIMSRVKDPQRTMKVLGYILAIKNLGGKRKMDYQSSQSKDIMNAVLHNQNRLLLVVEQLLEHSDGEAYLALNQLHSLISLNAAF
ncbi:hypothetical protein BDQ17DRAFT_1411513 [Cyathus striatus]|nr:hypothetical protein BDQ17DRAFT_1411513 [Cyathus striatus]